MKPFLGRTGFAALAVAIAAAGCTAAPQGPGGGSSLPPDARQPVEIATSFPVAGVEDEDVIVALQTALGQPVLGELRVVSRDGSAIRVAQSLEGVPVIAGEAAIVIADDGTLSMVGEFTNTMPPPTGAIDTLQVANDALSSGETLDAVVGVQVLDPLLVEGTGPVRTVVTLEVTSPSGSERRSIDAITGAVLLEEHLSHEALSRTVCDAQEKPFDAISTCGGPTTLYELVRTESGPISSVDAANKVFDYSGDTYLMMSQLFGIDSFDRRGAPIVSTVNICGIPFFCRRGAFYSSTAGPNGQLFFSADFVSDDIVAHEIGHGITRYSSRLIYSGESGGLNESMSDVYGEVVDLRNARGNDSAAVRWRLGEDSNYGTLRNMANPPEFDQPDWTGSSLNKPGADVHVLSGIPNKTFSLLADGGAFRGTTVEGLGVDNAARLFQMVNSSYLTSGASFSMFGKAMRLACRDMVIAGKLQPLACTSVVAALAATGIDSALTSVPVTGDFDGDGKADTVWYSAGAGNDYLTWGSSRNDLTTGASLVAAYPVSGVYIPVVGDIDGDGREDIIWYSAGSSPDYVWWGSTNRISFAGGNTSMLLPGISGDYRPVAGDVDGDLRDDVIWYAPGAAADFVWWGGARNSFGPANSAARTVGGVYWPVVADVDGDMHDDVIWHAPGASTDYVWWGSNRADFGLVGVPFSVNGDYRPVAGDVDGDLRDDVIWYASGAAADFVWWGSANRSTFLTGGTGQPLAAVNGTYRPTVADFDGDGPEDVQWFAPGSAPDFRWFGSASRAQFSSGSTVQRAYGL